MMISASHSYGNEKYQGKSKKERGKEKIDDEVTVTCLLKCINFFFFFFDKKEGQRPKTNQQTNQYRDTPPNISIQKNTKKMKTITKQDTPGAECLMSMSKFTYLLATYVFKRAKGELESLEERIARN